MRSNDKNKQQVGAQIPMRTDYRRPGVIKRGSIRPAESLFESGKTFNGRVWYVFVTLNADCILLQADTLLPRCLKERSGTMNRISRNITHLLSEKTAGSHLRYMPWFVRVPGRL